MTNNNFTAEFLGIQMDVSMNWETQSSYFSYQISFFVFAMKSLQVCLPGSSIKLDFYDLRNQQFLVWLGGQERTYKSWPHQWLHNNDEFLHFMQI